MYIEELYKKIKKSKFDRGSIQQITQFRDDFIHDYMIAIMTNKQKTQSFRQAFQDYLRKFFFHYKGVAYKRIRKVLFFDTVNMTDTYFSHGDVGSFEEFDLQKQIIDTLDQKTKKIVLMLIDGYTLKEIGKKVKMKPLSIVARIKRLENIKKIK